MNAKPHTHQITVRRQYQHSPSGHWYVEYGDTTVKMWNWVPRNKAKALRKKALKAIRKHDKGTLAAATYVETMDDLLCSLNRPLASMPNVGEPAKWGSELIQS